MKKNVSREIRRLVKEISHKEVPMILDGSEKVDLRLDVERIVGRRFVEKAETLLDAQDRENQIANAVRETAEKLKEVYDGEFAPRMSVIRAEARLVFGVAFADRLTPEVQDELVQSIITLCWRRMPLPPQDAPLSKRVRDMARKAIEEVAVVEQIHRGIGGAFLDLWRKISKAIDNAVRIAPEEDREDLKQTVVLRLLEAAPRVRIGSANKVVGYARTITFNANHDIQAERARLIRESDLAAEGLSMGSILETLMEPVVNPDVASSRQVAVTLLNSGLEPCLILALLARMGGRKPAEIDEDFGNRSLNKMAQKVFIPFSFNGCSFDPIKRALRKKCRASVAAKRSSCGATTLRQHQSEHDFRAQISHWIEAAIDRVREMLSVVVPKTPRKKCSEQVQSTARPKSSSAVVNKAPTSSRRAASISKP